MKKHFLTNSKSERGITKLNSNAFTLIELLAIIVILAIIAVITVPIILNIIENSRKGVASDSAYGYKDSVNKSYIAELQNHNKLKLNDTYTVTNGTLSGGNFGDEGITSLPVSVSGQIPSSGILRYSNNVLNAGCLAIGDYRVTFDISGKVNEAEKGDCSNYTLPSDNSILTMAEMCPGCVFAIHEIDTNDKRQGIDTVTNAKEDYRELNRYTFFGYVLDENTNIIQKTFACAIHDTKPFCFEATKDSTKQAENIALLNQIFQVENPDDGYGNIVYEDDYVYIFMNPLSGGGYYITIESPDVGYIDMVVSNDSNPITSGHWSS